jgi:hypothetical protein
MHDDPDLISALRSLAILSPTSFAWGGEEPCEVPAAVGPAGDPLVASLQGMLYVRAYSHGCEEPFPPPPPGPPDPAFAARLARANQGRARWDPAWQVYQTGPDGQLFVRKGERHRATRPGEYAAEVAPGGRVSLAVRTESFTDQPGFYYLYGETLDNAWDEAGLVRFYFHASADGVCALIEGLSAQLNRFFVPYRMKTLTDRGSYGRADATVLYVTRGFIPIVARIIQLLPAAASAGLRPRVPLFTWRLRPGVGVAEEPHNGESFGMHRCRLVAEGIVDAWKRRERTLEDRLRAVAQRFHRHGLLLDRPYLNAGSTDYFPALCAEGAAA